MMHSIQMDTNLITLNIEVHEIHIATRAKITKN